MRWWIAALLGFAVLSNGQAQMPRLSEALRTVPLQDPDPIPTIRPPAQERVFRLTSADEASQDGDVVTLKGNVRFTYREYTVTCDEAEGNLKTEIFTLRGNVFLSGPNLNYEGKNITANFKDETVQFTSARTVVKPSIDGSPLQDNLYIRGEGGSGSERRYTLDRGTCTTCNLEKPHYHISAKTIDVFAGEKVILRDARLHILGKTVLRLPYLSIPLDETAPRYIPEFGQSPDEGYFIKTRFGIGIPGDDTLDARVAYMTKLGVGLGGDFSYRDQKMAGDVRAYSILGPSPTTTANLRHNQRIGSATLVTNVDYGQRNYLTAPNNTTLNLRNLISMPTPGGQTRFTINRNSNRSSNFRTVNQNFQISNSVNTRNGFSSTIDLNYSDYDTTSTSFSQQRQVLDVRTNVRQRLPSLDAELAYQRTVPISEIVNFFSSTDITPLFSVRSDFTRLFGKSFGARLPLLAEVSVGELIDSVRRRPIGRTNMEFILPQRSLDSGNTEVRIAGRFKQSFYSDDTAQFIFGADTSASYEFHPGSKFNIRYNYLRPQGFTPLSLDRTGRNDLFGGDVSVRLGKEFLLAAQSGYDMLARDRSLPSGWQSVGARLEYLPNENFQLRSSATYDTFSKVWNVVRMDSQFRVQGANFGLGIRFDGQRSTWGAINLIGEGLRWGRLGTSFLLAYNGYTRTFESRQFLFTYDMHCTEALLEIIDNQTGFRNGTSVAFYLRLKALPFSTPFGRGTRGQGVGTGSGFSF